MSGNTVRVLQRNQVRFGPFAVPVETVRDVRLLAPARLEGRLVSGSMKKYDSVTELIPEAGGWQDVPSGFYSRPLLARFNPDGTPDQSFGTAGVQTVGIDLGGSFTSTETATLSILPKPACKLLIPRESQQVP